MSNMHIGEKIETVLLKRTNGAYGEYLGCEPHTVGDGSVVHSVRVEGHVYYVHDTMWLPPYPYYVVTREGSESVFGADKYGLGLIKASDFK